MVLNYTLKPLAGYLYNNPQLKIYKPKMKTQLHIFLWGISLTTICIACFGTPGYSQDDLYYFKLHNSKQRSSSAEVFLIPTLQPLLTQVRLSLNEVCPKYNVFWLVILLLLLHYIWHTTGNVDGDGFIHRINIVSAITHVHIVY